MTLAWHPANPVNVAKGIEIPSYSLEDVTWYTGKEEFTTGRCNAYGTDTVNECPFALEKTIKICISVPSL